MTTDLATLTAEELLAIPAAKPERLFKGDADTVKKAYRKLAMLWHPDHSSKINPIEVFQHVKALYEKAEKLMEAGQWEDGGPLLLTDTSGRKYEIKYHRRHEFELGLMYVSDTAVTFLVDRANADLVKRAEDAIKGFTYANDRMRDEISKLLPAYPFVGAFQTDTSYAIVMRKTADVLLLRDVLDHFGGRMDSRHVAWVVSRLLNLCCYLQYAGITHNGLSIDTCFISPPHHSVSILGGWWYSARAGDRMVAAPNSTIEWGPHDLMATKKANIRTDLEIVRAIGRQLLGDISGMRLGREKAAKEAMINWLRLPASDDAIKEYGIWRNQVLQDSFGARRFVELPLTSSDIYR
jgi:hypothetical protein